MKIIRAKFESSCAECKGKVDVGQKVWWEPGKRVIHEDCLEVREGTTPKKIPKWKVEKYPDHLDLPREGVTDRPPDPIEKVEKDDGDLHWCLDCGLPLEGRKCRQCSGD